MGFNDPKWNPALSTYNLSASSTARWRAQRAKAIRGQRTSQVVLLGDSIFQGEGSTPQRSFNPAAGLRATLGKIAPSMTVGEGASFNTGQVQTDYDPRWQVGASTWARTNSGLINASQQQVGAGGGTLAFGPVTCDHFKLYYRTHPINGTMNWNVDGGANTPLNLNGTDALHILDINTGSVAAHTLNMVAPGSGFAMVTGVGWYTAASPNNFEVVTGGGLAAQTSSELLGSNLDTLSILAPDATIICLGRNDSGGTSGASTYKANIATTVSYIRNTMQQDVFLCTPPPMPTTYAYPNENDIFNYLYQIADEYDVCVINLKDIFTAGWASAPLSTSADGIHFNDDGSWVCGNAIANVLAA